MAITQIIATLPAVLNDSATFYEDIAERNNSLVTTVLPSINDWATQANTTQIEINAKAAQVAAQAVDGGYSQNYINDNFVNQDINTLTNKTTPTNADEMVIADSASSFSLKKLSFTNLKATLLAYFDTLYSRTSAIFGIGQTSQNVTASRALNVTYTNDTVKPIFISARFSLGVSSDISLTIGSNTHGISSASVIIDNTLSLFVLPGETYKAQVTIGTGFIVSWHEIR